MKDAPLIGISTSELREPREHVNRPESEPPMRELALGLTYPEAIARGGGVPVVIPPFRSDYDIAALLERLDGICLSGGPDLHPRLYGAEPDPHLGPTEPEVDESEFALARAAIQRHVPLLCICRGAQLLNIVRGGTLVQHLPDHRQTEPGRLPTHRVTIDPSSKLAAALGGRTGLEVNSFHHQAVDRLGGNLRAVAWSEDGIVEAIEATDRPFAIGVQWHAEGLVEAAEQRALFEAFLAATVAGRAKAA